MLSAAEGILLFVATSEAVLGTLGNTFVAFVNCMDCARNKKLSKIGFILTGLATSRICLMWIITFDTYVKLFSTHTLSYGKIYECISYLWVTMNHLSIWFAASLSIFYFLKIANFSHCVFTWLKRRADSVFITMVGCFFVSLFISIPQIVKMIDDIKMQYRNISWQVHLDTPEAKELLFSHVFFQFGILFFFMVTVITCLLLIISLWRHNKQMQANVLGFRDLNTEAHMKAMKVLISFIVLFVLYFVGLLIEILCFLWPNGKLLLVLGVIIVLMYPCCHSFILILANNQLKKVSLKLLQQLKRCDSGELRDTRQCGMGTNALV
ncbi:taste receptor type 2 member 104-like [Phodopus roborovskii]|uniref:taste receptor type 2 member 104-like n=1 Tax=Phodopus roborovskii TaxID=109678 RepID=UPI0021E39D58|nr:taste receptor type 2 member 104-like [Phodopus roborovskii]